MAAKPRVDFLIAGAQKGGTTALHDYLAETGEVALGEVKELHFFDDDSLDWSLPPYDAYHTRFPAPDGRPCGEATPIYGYWPKSLERIAAYNPAMKLIFVLRDPVQRAWSHWRMEDARGVETEPFAWCVRAGRQRLFAAEPWGHHREFSYVERGFYGEQMERVFGLFPRQQVLVLCSDDLRADPGAALGRVRDLLGLSHRPAPTARAVHVGREMDYGSDLTEGDAAWLRDLYAADDQRLRALTRVSFSA